MSVLPSSLSPTERRRAEDFAVRLDGSRTGTDPELEPLLALAALLRPARIVARPDFRAALRETLVAEASARTPAAVPAQRRAPDEPARRVRRFVAAGVTLSLVLGAGAAAASTRALPGDSWYGVRRALESVELRLAGSDLSRGRELLEQADNRLSEAESLAASGDSRSARTTALIATALADMDAATRAGAEALNAAYAETGDREPLVLLNRFVVEQRGRLADLADLLDPALRPRIVGLADLLARLQTHLTLRLAVTSEGTTTTASAKPTAGATDTGKLGSDLGSDLGGTLDGPTGAGASASPGGTGGSGGVGVNGVGGVGVDGTGGGVDGGRAGTVSAPAVPSASAVPSLPVPSTVASVPKVVTPTVPGPAPATSAPAGTPRVSAPAIPPTVTCVPPLTAC